MNHHEMLQEGIKAAPPITVTGLTIYGIQLSDIVLIITLIYTVAQLVLLIPRYHNWYKTWRGKNAKPQRCKQ